jgi:hypothetical protein
MAQVLRGLRFFMPTSILMSCVPQQLSRRGPDHNRRYSPRYGKDNKQGLEGLYLLEQREQIDDTHHADADNSLKRRTQLAAISAQKSRRTLEEDRA